MCCGEERKIRENHLKMCLMLGKREICASENAEGERKLVALAMELS